MPQDVIRNWEDARGLDPRSKALLETPGEWVRGVAGLIAFSEEFKAAGLLVTNVGPNGAAAKAGIARGDVLIRYDGVELDSAASLREAAARAARAGLPFGQIEAMRGGAERQFKVEVGRLGVTVSASLYREKLPRVWEASLKTKSPVFNVTWRPL